MSAQCDRSLVDDESIYTVIAPTNRLTATQRSSLEKMLGVCKKPLSELRRRAVMCEWSLSMISDPSVVQSCVGPNE
jgi:hypothetical protein